MAEGKAWTDFDGSFGGKYRLFWGIGECAANRQRIVRIWASFIEPNGPQTRVKAFLDVERRIVTPTIGHDSGTDAAKPGVRLCEFAVEPACCPKQVASMQVGLPANPVEMPGALPNQIPS